MRALAIGVVTISAALAACGPAVVPCGDGCPANSACNPTTNTCEALPACSTDADCSGGAACVNHVCATCQNLSCTVGYTSCDTATSACQQCNAQGSCPANLPFCGDEGCTQCRNDADCPATQSCVQRWCVECLSTCSNGLDCDFFGCRKGCLSSADCPAGAPFCDGSGHCVECQSSNDCPAGTACIWKSCRAAFPGGSCREAWPLSLAAGSTAVQGVLQDGLLVNWSSNYQYYAAYYRVEVPGDGYLDVNLDVINGGARAVVYRGSCAALERLAGAPDVLHDLPVAAGTYWIAVESSWSFFSTTTQRPFTLTVAFRGATLPDGISCAHPLSISAGGAQHQLVTRDLDLTAIGPVFPDQCDEDPPNPDAVIALDLAQDSAVRIFADYDAYAALRVVLSATCGEDTPGYCSYEAGPYPVTIWQTPLAAGRYYLHLRTNRAVGPVHLEIETWPWPTAGTRCDNAVALALDGGAASVTGDSRIGEWSRGVCGEQNGPTSFYALDTAGLGDHSIEIRSAGAPAPTVALHDRCPLTDAGVLGCAQSGVDGGDRIERLVLPEGVYLLEVQRHQDGGPYQVDLALGPPYYVPANDSCATGAEELVLDGGTFAATGQTRAAANDFTRCTGPGGDVVYHLDFQGRAVLEAQVRATSAEFAPVVSATATYQPGGCAGTSVYCGPSDGGQVAVRYLDWDAGGSWLWVDSNSPRGGTFALSGALKLPPANDQCGAAITLTPGVAVQGDLHYAHGDETPCQTVSQYEPNLFYKYTASANGTATVTLTPNGFAGEVGMQTACTGLYNTYCQWTTNGGVGAPVTFSRAVTRNTTYWFNVTGYFSDPSPGTFTLLVNGP